MNSQGNFHYRNYDNNSSYNDMNLEKINEKNFIKKVYNNSNSNSFNNINKNESSEKLNNYFDDDLITIKQNSLDQYLDDINDPLFDDINNNKICKKRNSIKNDSHKIKNNKYISKSSIEKDYHQRKNQKTINNMFTEEKKEKNNKENNNLKNKNNKQRQNKIKKIENIIENEYLLSENIFNDDDNYNNLPVPVLSIQLSPDSSLNSSSSFDLKNNINLSEFDSKGKFNSKSEKLLNDQENKLLKSNTYDISNNYSNSVIDENLQKLNNIVNETLKSFGINVNEVDHSIKKMYNLKKNKRK